MESFGSSENRFIAAGILSSLLLCSLALHGAEVASSVPSAFGLDTLTPKGNADGIVLFDFETEAEHEAVRAVVFLYSWRNRPATGGRATSRAVFPFPQFHKPETQT